MKKKNARIIALAITVVMLMGCIPITASADEIAPMTIAASEAQGVPGTTVEVRVSVKNNPGFTSLKFLAGYDAGVLNLKTVKINDDITANTQVSPISANPVIVNYFKGNENYSKDAVIATFSFEILDTAFEGDYSDIVITFSQDDIFDTEENAIEIEVVNGKVTVISCIPGDINGDEKVNNKDLMRLFQHLSGLDVVVNEPALDTNGDGKINNKDLMRLFQHLSGLEVELFPKPGSGERCRHEMTAREAVNATCTEDGSIAYWECTKCGKLFADAKGSKELSLDDIRVYAHHRLEYVPAKEASVDASGNYEYWQCTECEKVFTDADGKHETTIENLMIKSPDAFKINYIYTANDPYLAKLNIPEPEPKTYYSNIGVTTMPEVSVEGYEFKGWYTSAGQVVTSIPVGSTGDYTLNAKWEKQTYYVTFDSPDVPFDNAGEDGVPKREYTVDTGLTINNPSWFGYTFVGWSDDNGFIVDRIKPGTTGNITLHANWTSNRNRATSYSTYDAPLVLENAADKQFLFVYDIGKIENVPLSVINNFGLVPNLHIEEEYEYKTKIDKSTAESITRMVSNATTRSSGWTLSDEWNEYYEAEEAEATKQVRTDERTDSEGRTVGGNYFVSNSEGGSSYMSVESGGSNFSSARVTTDTSFGLNTSYDKSTEKYCDAKLGFENKTEVGASVSFPVKVVKVGAEVKNTSTFGAEVANGRRDTESSHFDSNYSSQVGTDYLNTSSSYYNTEASRSSNWNTNSGFEKSYNTSIDSQTRAAVSDEIGKTTSYNLGNSLSGSNSKTETISGITSDEDGYSNTIMYDEGTEEVKRQKLKYDSDIAGYYRAVLAGTIHVYGVVGYDIATATYYTYTYNVLDDERHFFLDYTKSDSSYTLCENGLVTFEIPFEVQEYISAVTSQTAGLISPYSGVFDDIFEPEETFNGIASIPQYYSVDNSDGSFSAYSTKGFTEDVFKGNTTIKTIILPVTVTTIPARAFKGCTSLENVIAYGVTEIGEEAFSGCTSLKSFSIDSKVGKLGATAFVGVNELSVKAANRNVADAAIKSGAENIRLDISLVEDNTNEWSIKVPKSTKSFSLIGNGKTYSELLIDSDADSTFISNINFAESKGVPIRLSSESVSLARVNVNDAPGYALVLTANSTELKLQGEIALNSKSNNAVISKNVSLSRLNAAVTGRVNIGGDHLVCGNVSNASLRNFSTLASGEKGIEKLISEEEFERLIASYMLSFETNGGSRIEPISVSNGTVLTSLELPTPIKEHYTFAGWYLESNEPVNDHTVFSDGNNHTLVAHWTENKYSVIFDPNGGNVALTSKDVTYGSTYGELPVPTKDYYTFTGWYTAAEGGKIVTEDSITLITEAQTLYAHWEENAITDWVKKSDAPSDAQIVETKWTYDKKSTTTSTNSSMSGWTQDGFNWSNWSDWADNQVSKTENRDVETRNDLRGYNKKTQYNYSRYYGKSTNDGYYYALGFKSGICVNFEEYGWSDEPLKKSGTDSYGYQQYSVNGNSSTGYRSNSRSCWWYNEKTQQVDNTDSPIYVTQYRYRDKIFNYFKIDHLTSETYPSGDNLSNIVEMVRYREK